MRVKAVNAIGESDPLPLDKSFIAKNERRRANFGAKCVSINIFVDNYYEGLKAFRIKN